MSWEVRADPIQGEVLGKNLVGANKGDVWTGFEWVSPARYEQLKANNMPNLPPIQPTAGEPAPVVPQQPPPPAPACPEPPAECTVGKGGSTPGYSYSTAVPDVLVPYLHDENLATVRRLLCMVGEDPGRGGLLETPARVVQAWMDWTAGYSQDAADILKVFADGAEGSDEMVVVADIPIYSHCEHHLAPIFGTATIAYIPDGRIVGLSKLNRLADMFARRLQVQERMTNQIADALWETVGPRGCGVVIKARHMCMESRGVRQGSHTTTSALRGIFKSDPTVRAEFLALAR